ncbi:sporulation inhibitor of replication protein SirA [Halalkalibacter oceani]|uniref:Sporulation inhibitor of replication protein SirA n=1 Tax=Halalkalibacter oceani TaxID=1653776 RepID=A0A9X2DM63_9BACI|nr:sporulation inhibitor of replication protein SirA [Halalkalibacter oceani]MCM3713304.1 sporulation inhibitor of replication protein SirA [Halalkalibacter oceani]
MMRHYELFIFEESVARQYYGQEAKLFHLFKEHEQARGEKRELLSKQIEYITKPIPALLLQQKLNEAFSYERGYIQHKNRYFLDLFSRGAKAELMIERRALYLTSDGEESTEAETMFFEVLRKCEPTFFALSLNEQRFGWLRPIKQQFPLSQSHG